MHLLLLIVGSTLTIVLVGSGPVLSELVLIFSLVLGFRFYSLFLFLFLSPSAVSGMTSLAHGCPKHVPTFPPCPARMACLHITPGRD